MESVNEVEAIAKACEGYKNVLKQVNSARIIGLTLNTALLSEEDANNLIKEVKERIHLPVIDPIRSEVTDLIETVKRIDKLSV